MWASAGMTGVRMRDAYFPAPNPAMSGSGVMIVSRPMRGTVEGVDVGGGVRVTRVQTASAAGSSS